MAKKFNYENKQYLDKLNALQLSYYSKYISFIKRYLGNNKGKFLDVGCGNGVVIEALQKDGYKNGYGVDISRLFIKDAKKKGLEHVYAYDGSTLPFKNNYFDLIGSFNVLEHTEKPNDYIEQQLKVLKKGGHIIISCPNFLSVLFPSKHRRLHGLKNKLHNLSLICKKLIIKDDRFEMMPPIIQEYFEYDDDAIVVTNMLDVTSTLRANGCTVVYTSGFINYDSAPYKVINALPFIKYLLPSCFVVAKKN